MADVDACHIPVELCGFTPGEWLPRVVAVHGSIGGDERVGAQLVKFSLYALPVGFGEALKIHVVAGEVFEACQIEGCGAVVAGGGVELGEVVGNLLHHDSFSSVVCWWFLSCSCRDDGVEVDRVDHVVEFLSLTLGECLPVSWPVYGAVEGDRPVGSDEPDGFLYFNTVQVADDRRAGVAHVASCWVCGVEWVDFCLSVEGCVGWGDECAIHAGVLLSVVYGLLWFLECVGCNRESRLRSIRLSV